MIAVALVSQARALPAITVGIDADSTGNAADSLGEIQDCRRVAQGDTFEVDVFVQGLPESPPGRTPLRDGLAGFSFDVLYDPAVVKINSANADMLIKQEDPQNELFFMSGTEPDSDGDYRVDVAQLGSSGTAPLFESGDGVLIRITIEATGPGITAVVLGDIQGGDGSPDVYDAGSDAYALNEVQNAAIAVGQACATPPALPANIAAQATSTKAPSTPAPASPSSDGTGATGGTGEGSTPTPGGTATGESGDTATGGSGESSTPTPSGSPSSGPATISGLPTSEGMSLGVDVIPPGNDATSLAVVEPCASAQVGDKFEVDLVIQDVADLLAWEIGLSYDPAVLEVQDRDVQMFQAANTGSSVLDISGETPDSSGRYTLSAVDTADPSRPDSGSGVLARITFKAIAEGTSPISLEKVDLDGDGTPDQGPFLRAHSGDIIGDDDGDTFFDGPTFDAEIRVGEPCPGAQGVEGDQEGPTVRTIDDDSGIGTGVIVAVAGGIAALIAAGGLAAFLIRRRRQPSTGQ